VTRRLIRIAVALIVALLLYAAWVVILVERCERAIDALDSPTWEESQERR